MTTDQNYQQIYRVGGMLELPSTHRRVRAVDDDRPEHAQDEHRGGYEQQHGAAFAAHRRARPRSADHGQPPSVRPPR